MSALQRYSEFQLVKVFVFCIRTVHTVASMFMKQQRGSVVQTKTANCQLDFQTFPHVRRDVNKQMFLRSLCPVEWNRTFSPCLWYQLKPPDVSAVSFHTGRKVVLLSPPLFFSATLDTLVYFMAGAQALSLWHHITVCVSAAQWPCLPCSSRHTDTHSIHTKRISCKHDIACLSCTMSDPALFFNYKFTAGCSWLELRF